jgi:signal transduction histidine kinase
LTVAPKTPLDASREEGASMNGPATILIVDDSPINLQLLKLVIGSSTEYRTITAEDGRAVFEITDKKDAPLPDLILLDIMMPEMDGFEVARRLKSDERTAGIPILFITALGDVESKVRAFQNGGVDYISKPFNKDELMARVDAQIRVKMLNDELKKKNEELQCLNVELGHLNEQKNQLIGMVAHDLRSPLTVIMGVGDLLGLQAKESLTERQLKYLERMKSSSLYMLGLINNLLDVNMVESGNLRLDLDKTDLAALIRQSVDLNNFLAEGKGISITFNEETVLPPLSLDRSKIEQVLNNVLSNAVKYSEGGCKVVITLTSTPSLAIISVKDEGLGIPQEDLENIFKAFEKGSTRPTAGEKSLGLGLAIVKKIVEGHRGGIGVESQVGVGTTFHISLPLA